MEEIKANPLSFLNKVVPFPQNKYYYLGMIAAAAAVAAEWNHLLVFELRSFANKIYVFILSYLKLFLFV